MIVELIFVMVLAAVAAAISYQRLLLRPRSAGALPDPDRLRVIAERLGLEVEEDATLGAIDGFTVRIEEGEGDRHRFTIDTHGRVPNWLRIDENRTPKKRRAPPSGIETHDRFFDERFSVFGPLVGASALLGSGVRRALLELGRVQLNDGVLIATITASRTQAIERAFRQLLEAARLLASSTRYDERLLQIATTDQNPFVRFRALEVMAVRRPHADETQRALWLALDDPHIPAALFAAIKLGANVARDHLKRLARLAASADEERIAAFRELLAHERPEEMLPLLLEASRSYYGKFTARAIEWTVQHGGRDALLSLLEQPGATQSENLIAFLGKTAELMESQGKLDPELERAVLRILLDTRRRLFEARRHAASLLGAYGSSRSIPALKEVGKGELDATPAIAKTAREAVARIQARKSGMSGGLALVDPEGGDLSFSDADTGALSAPPAQSDAESSR